MAHKPLGPDQFGIDILKDGFKVILPDRLIPRDDLKILLEGIRDLITEYNNVTMEALRERKAVEQLNLLDILNPPTPESDAPEPPAPDTKD